ncbi:hypothetical protein HMPREF0591_4400 [Mycobacterium parascrofulaceum ATCC BAA-614]|uniref:Uncharacterized protein n=1 Tax=Mycobacterium parascrofulaceum ATCC BAA-614 TaxID=525368 RepID=D5PE06_9MYCO|nr:hypothetical protein HMPREF0591_4400 [Mycobacterium parascrofulaceum ATCC BAA-614]
MAYELVVEGDPYGTGRSTPSMNRSFRIRRETHSPPRVVVDTDAGAPT